ncbi:PREDICTED: mitochondrial 2-oxodicarboxylate carrier isoform X2 [Myotis brandtii]|uniref:mitochondrial 2-oxodicarboxylate carrier isoform X2 n=1 Tax=Myotis brandtii TaxID=109478 RepID=UPI0007040E5E|nr:PREDICTED: mitochondrial 2-oxodicarboxylate carrier isoform X2 [Myotis brandtii]
MSFWILTTHDCGLLPNTWFPRDDNKKYRLMVKLLTVWRSIHAVKKEILEETTTSNFYKKNNRPNYCEERPAEWDLLILDLNGFYFVQWLCECDWKKEEGRKQTFLNTCYELGLVEICLMHPLDVVKTRFQIQRCSTDPNSYKSLGDSFRTIFRTEGLFGFYKGILPPILAETPKRAVKFFTFEQYKKLLGYVSLSPALTFAIAGLGSGLTEAIVVNPFEVVKVGLQANRNTFTEQPSTMSYARHIIKKEGLGLQGLNKGFTATLGRHGVFNMVYFGFYYNVKNIIPVNKDPTLEFLRKFGIGLLSGTIASVINIPFDVAKSRIQGPQPVPGEIKYRTCFKTMATVYQEEGILALYKGLLPKIMRLGPGFL